MQCQISIMKGKNDIFNDESLEKEAPILASIPKRNPYTVPEGYFDSLPSAIMEKCRESKPIPATGFKIFWLFRPQWMIATMVCVIGITFFLRHNPVPASLETLTAQVSDSTIYQNLQNNIDYVDVNTLEDALQTESVSAIPERSDSANNQQDIVNYLMNHNVNASDIENEL